jgi:hypothetical protein
MTRSFPDGFERGSASAAHQIEGSNWNNHLALDGSLLDGDGALGAAELCLARLLELFG